MRFAPLLFVGLLFAFCPPGFGQQPAIPMLERGVALEHVSAVSDPGQQFAVYLPSAYEPDRSTPVLLLMDPRGRAMIPLNLFKDAAERHGYVLLSSYRTLSDQDTAFVANDKALAAMLADARERFKVDGDRIYLAGFSGTAHYSWNIAPTLDGHLAGIVGVGGGLPAYSAPIQKGMMMKRPFAYYGIAGIGDFNYDGVRWLDEALDTTRVPHRFVSHDGRHQWPPKEITEDAVDWFEIQAMRTGLRGVDKKFVKETRKRAYNEAKAFERSGDTADAMRRYREIAADYDGLKGDRDARERYEALVNDPGVIQIQYDRDALSRRVFHYKLRQKKVYQEYDRSRGSTSKDVMLKNMQIRQLQEETRDKDDRQLSGAARRMLASAFANAGFYRPRDYMRRRKYAMAVGMLEIAQEIYPNLARTCLMLAQAHAQLGHEEEGINALQCALDGGAATGASIAEDKLLIPLQQSVRYADLVRRDS